MLTAWRETTKREYPGQKDLLEMITSPCQLLMERIAKGGWIMTDSCNAAQKFRRFLIEDIIKIAKKEGMTRNQINIFESGKLYNILLHDLQIKTLIMDCYCFVLM